VCGVRVSLERCVCVFQMRECVVCRVGVCDVCQVEV
jgi:hypothetical protein